MCGVRVVRRGPAARICGPYPRSISIGPCAAGTEGMVLEFHLALNLATSLEMGDRYGSQRSGDPQAGQTGGSQSSSGELSRNSGGSAGETLARQAGGSQLSSGELSRYSGGSGGETQAGQIGGSQLSSGEHSTNSGSSAGESLAGQTGGSQLSSGELSRYSGGSDADKIVLLKGQRPTPETKGIIYQWRNGIVPYFIDEESYDDIIVDRIDAATKVIERASCILFTKVAKQDLPQFGYSFLHFSNPDKERECVHTVMRGSQGEPTLVLGYDCMQERDIIHALMHLLGFRDEVTHPQRDSYVRVLWENIQPKYRHLFSITLTPLHQEMGEYDTMSIMHFHDRAYSINGAPTIAPLIPGQLIHPSDQLSLLDKMKLRLAFRHECNRRKVANLLQTCKNSIQGTIDNKIDATGNDANQECNNDTNNIFNSGSESGSDENGTEYITEKGIAAYVSTSDKDEAAKDNKGEDNPLHGNDKGSASSGSDKDKGGALSGSNKDKGGASSGSDKGKGGTFSGSDKGESATHKVLGLKGLVKHRIGTTKKRMY